MLMREVNHPFERPIKVIKLDADDGVLCMAPRKYIEKMIANYERMRHEAWKHCLVPQDSLDIFLTKFLQFFLKFITPVIMVAMGSENI